MPILEEANNDDTSPASNTPEYSKTNETSLEKVLRNLDEAEQE